MTEVLDVKIRDQVGTRGAKRVRKAGNIPAVLYGHGSENVNLAVPAEQLEAALRHGSQLVELRGDVQDTALIREVQWDTFGMRVLHLDFVRVSAQERVEVTVSLELRGEAPGAKEGGMVEQVAHEIEIECPASAIPDKIGVRVHELTLGGTIKMSDVPLPEDWRLLSDPDEIVVHCVAPAEAPEEAAEAAEAGEPEVIGRTAGEQESNES